MGSEAKPGPPPRPDAALSSSGSGSGSTNIVMSSESELSMAMAMATSTTTTRSNHHNNSLCGGSRVDHYSWSSTGCETKKIPIEEVMIGGQTLIVVHSKSLQPMAPITLKFSYGYPCELKIKRIVSHSGDEFVLEPLFDYGSATTESTDTTSETSSDYSIFGSSESLNLFDDEHGHGGGAMAKAATAAGDEKGSLSLVVMDEDQR